MILGEGPERATLESLVQQRGLQEIVALPGFVDNPYACMHRAGVFVLSSNFEGLSTAPNESLALGTPVVSTDCESGPREILRDGALGEPVPVGDADARAGRHRARSSRAAPSRLPQILHLYSLDTTVDQFLDACGLERQEH